MTRLLPGEFHLGHDLAFCLHDLLARFVVEGEQAELHQVEFAFNRPEDMVSLQGLQGEGFWQWCEANGYRHVLEQVSYRNLIFGLLSDMCQFLYEGLKCSENGKLSVAYSNFRKPVQDNLFHLEWILADWPDFLARYRRDARQFDMTKFGGAKKATIVEMIGKAMDKTPLGRWFDPETLYEIRYEKDSASGLDPIFNHALHLVTTRKHYETPTENINFIFCQDDDREQLWRQLYLQLPVVLVHAWQVVRALFKTIAPEFDLTGVEAHEMLLGAGLLLWAESIEGVGCKDGISALLREYLEQADLECSRCGAAFILEGTNVRPFWDSGEVECAACRQKMIPCLRVSDDEKKVVE